jgi:hypothetical protein
MSAKYGVQLTAMQSHSSAAKTKSGAILDLVS